MLIIDQTSNKYDMLFCKYLDLLPLNLVLENGYFVLEKNISVAAGAVLSPQN